MAKKVSYIQQFSVILLCLATASCSSRITVKEIDLSEASLPRNAGITIDGDMCEGAWSNAAVLPLEKTGKAKFVWDDSTLYGFISGQKNIFPSIDKQLCVSVRTRKKNLLLCFEQDGFDPNDNLPRLFLEQVVFFVDEPSGKSTRRVLPPDTINICDVVSRTETGFNWALELSIPWSSLGLTSPKGYQIQVEVYRRVPKKDDHVLTMGVAQEYFALFLNIKRVGYITQNRIVESNMITTTTTTHYFLRPSTEETFETSIETPFGKPLGFETEKIKGIANEQGGFEILPKDSSKMKKRIIDWPEGALMDEGFRLLLKENGLVEGTSFICKIFYTDELQACERHVSVGPTKNVELIGRIVPLTEITITDKTPLGTLTWTDYVDNDFKSQKSVCYFGGLELKHIACGRELALSKDAVVDLADIVGIVPSPKRVKNLFGAKWTSYYLLPTEYATLEIPSTDYQTVCPSEKGGLIVTVHHTKPPIGFALPYDGGNHIALEALKPTALLQSDNEKIIALAEKAVGRTKDAAKAAKKIASFVYGYISNKKGLSTGKSAVEVAESKKGTCKEHAILNAAMCRAVGIPTRLVAGYRFRRNSRGCKNVFVGHMWTQVYIGDKWFPLDPSMPEFFGLIPKFTVGHIATNISDGNEDQQLDMVRSTGLFKIHSIRQ